MNQIREQALRDICLRYDTQPEFCGLETPEPGRLAAAMDALLAEIEAACPVEQPSVFVGEADEQAAWKSLAMIAKHGHTNTLMAMSEEDVSTLLAILRVARKQVEIMSASLRNWPQVPSPLADRDMALFVLVEAAIHG